MKRPGIKAFLWLRSNPSEDYTVLGDCEIYHGKIPGEFTAYQYACQYCGNHWAGFQPYTQKQPGLQYLYIRSKCPQCHGGSFHLWRYFPYDDLPYDALLHEIDLILTHGENYVYLPH